MSLSLSHEATVFFLSLGMFISIVAIIKDKKSLVGGWDVQSKGGRLQRHGWRKTNNRTERVKLGLELKVEKRVWG